MNDRRSVQREVFKASNDLSCNVTSCVMFDQRATDKTEYRGFCALAAQAKQSIFSKTSDLFSRNAIQVELNRKLHNQEHNLYDKTLAQFYDQICLSQKDSPTHCNRILALNPLDKMYFFCLRKF